MANQNIPFPGWKALENEKFEQKPQLVFVIKDNTGAVVRNIFEEAKPGVNRTSWDLRYPNFNPISLNDSMTSNNEDGPTGLLAAPGTYSVTMYLSHNGNVEQLDTPVTFEVKPLYKNTLEGSTLDEASDFWRSYESVSRTASAVDMSIAKVEKQTKALHKALVNSSLAPDVGLKQLEAIRKQIHRLKSDYYGNQAKLEIGEKNPPTVSDKLFTIYLSISRSTYGPTKTNQRQMQVITAMINNAASEVTSIENAIRQLEELLKASGAPYIDD